MTQRIVTIERGRGAPGARQFSREIILDLQQQPQDLTILAAQQQQQDQTIMAMVVR